ncbi:2-C-methyl-D-erythritol 4-phosphate cytidylyltransferase [Cellulomonas fengjieae]|uniref:2-C-methyl-D-erythritol 4-phosphate cytidylyltransferase n=1 Tax=Cellulomonas fengjieae TaxID=2819978 RepID=UPI001AAEEB56|nr:2-C-methyl-D-erythritol 4-phosphate cytidylyltransferase [Cellulomonas fengjieae]MBO3100761.1 2-C-methyl-D-erythritol 4-phosphate cytidylyltransferase [Cellulomonas fengjieae]
MSVAAVLTAAGSGSRLGHSLPKALVPLGGQSLVAHAARNLLAARAAGDDRVRVLVVTAPAFHVDAIARELADLADQVALLVVAGGATRQASVAAGLAALVADPRGAEADVVLVHDAARPLAPASLVARVIDAVRDGHPAVVPGVPVTDTIKRVAPHRGVTVEPVLETVPRTVLRAIQTPQGFTTELLLRAHAHGAEDAHDEALSASDDAGLVERLGEPVWVVAGDARAAKITTLRDLQVADLPTESDE